MQTCFASRNRILLACVLGILTTGAVIHSTSAQSRESTVVLAHSEDSGCQLDGITVTAVLGQRPGLSDTLPGAPTNRILYYANPQDGVITLTVLLTDTGEGCWLWSSPAFSRTVPFERYPVTSTPTLITYPVKSHSGPTATILITSSLWSTDSLRSRTILTFTQDLDPPSSTITAPSEVWGARVPLTWKAGDNESGIYSVTLWYSYTFPAGSSSGWEAYRAVAPRERTSGTLVFPPPVAFYSTSVSYAFATTARDYVGNEEATPPMVAEAEVLVHPAHLFMPLVVRNYRPLVNGSFDDGLNGWLTGKGPFNGHGNGVPQGVASFDGDDRALLGQPSASDGGIPVGYGHIAQTFTVDKRYLELQYYIITYDIVEGTDGYYDTFEVSVNLGPDEIEDAQRDDRGCSSTALNPEGALEVPSNGGLAFCGGRAGSASDAGQRWEFQDWKTVTLDLEEFQGQSITLYMAVWSREYKPPFWNNEAWYNTWVYVDEIKLRD